MPDLNDARRAGVKIPFHGEPIPTPRSGNGSDAGGNGSPKADLVCINDVEPEEVSWLWDRWFPLGKLAILDGDPGLGKSTMMLDIAARVSAGAFMPDDVLGASGSVIIITAEDGIGDTVRPRLFVSGADLKRCHALEGFLEAGGGLRPFILPDDVPQLSSLIEHHGVVLVIIDPLVAFLGGETNAHRDADVRRALAPLAKMAEKTGAAVVGIRHLNKMAGGAAIYRGGGSIAFTGASRSVAMIGRDPADSECRVLASVKSNLGPAPSSLHFRLVSKGAVAKVEWLGACDVTADQLCAGQRSEAEASAVDGAKEFLRALLEKGPQPSAKLKTEAKMAGVTWAAVRRAKDALGVKAEKVGFQDDSQWQWTLPGWLKTAESFEGAQTNVLSTFEEEGPAATPKSSMIPRRCSPSFEGAQLEGAQGWLSTFEGPPSKGDPNDSPPRGPETPMSTDSNPPGQSVLPGIDDGGPLDASVYHGDIEPGRRRHRKTI
jgi:hypothetical protein